MEEFNYFRHFELYENHKLGIFCKDRETAKTFLSFLEERGWQWGGGSKPTSELHCNKTNGVTYYGENGKQLMYANGYYKSTRASKVVEFKKW